ncbi:MAG: hypothetical protein IT323_10950 [Anaerolineae bacterium]|nr:hypothetical protein [Anaerolineae bacterium]
MAKKRSSRPNLPMETLERARAELRGDTLPVNPAAVAPMDGNGVASALAARPKVVRPSGVASRRIPTEEELNREYKFVVGDLRRLLVLAGLCILLVVVVSLVVLPAIPL